MKKFVAMLLALVMVLSLAACGGSDSANDGAADGGTVAVATGDGVTFYYPMFYNVFDASIQPDYDYALWFSTLWCMDYDNCSIDNPGTSYVYTEAAGDVADSWEVASDFSTVTVKIKEGVKFQTLDSAYDYYGGRELTAEDVAYSYNRLIGKVAGLDAVDASDYGWHAAASGDASGNAGGTGTMDILDYAEATDTYTVVFHMASQDETSVNTLITTSVNLCGAEWDALSEAQQSDWHYACGTGAFILTDYVQDQSMTFVKNPDYYGTVNVENVTLVYIADNTTITSQLEGGSLDWVGEKSSTNVLTSDQIYALTGNDNLVQYDYAGSAPMGIGMRMNIEPYSNLDFRIALQKLINMEDVLAYRGMSGVPTISGLWNVNSSWSASEKIQAELADDYEYDPEGAMETLAKYGYDENNKLQMVIAMDPMGDPTLIEYVASIYEQTGVIDVELEAFDDPMAQSMVVGDSTSDHVFGFTAGGLDTLLQAQLMTMEGGFGYGFFYDDTTYPELINKLATAESMADQAAIAQEADYYFTSQHWVIAIGGVGSETEFMSARIGNYSGQKVYGNGNMRVVLRNITL